jgi:hypothetical protein
MANDDWVEDVRRWYFGGNPPATEPESDISASPTAELGYETAHPSLQARHWPDAPALAKAAAKTAPTASGLR